MPLRGMRGRIGLVGSLLAATSLVGCATHTGTGALAGGGLGAATGAIIGSMSGNAGKGAAIGAALGAAGGGLIGAAKDENERQVAVAHARNAMSIQEVVDMSRSGVSDPVIIKQVHASGTVFRLSPADVTSLHQQGVSDGVVSAMLETARRPVVVAPRTVVVHEPPPIVVVDHCPPPPPVGVRFHYHR